MDGIFNGTAVKRERAAAEMSAQIEGLRRRIGDLQGEIKILKAKIAGQRAAIREKDETIRQLRETIAQMRKERSMFVRESIRHERAIRGLKHAVRMVCLKRDDQARELAQLLKLADKDQM